MNTLIKKIESKYMKKEPITVDVGSTIIISLRVIEGKRERLQNFEGIVIAKKGIGINKSMRIRKLSHNSIGVEKVVFLHSPNLKAIKVLKKGKPKRAKLYYLRNRKGKAALKVKS